MFPWVQKANTVLRWTLLQYFDSKENLEFIRGFRNCSDRFVFCRRCPCIKEKVYVKKLKKTVRVHVSYMDVPTVA